MMRISLRTYIVRYAVMSLLLGVVVVTTAFVIDAWLGQKRALSVESTALLTTGEKQVEQILPGILVSELYGSFELQLKSFAKQEELDGIRFTPLKDVPSAMFSSCRSQSSSFVCTQAWSNRLEVAVPITVTGRLLGYLVKEKTLKGKAARIDYGAVTLAIVGNVIVFLGILLSLLRFVDIHIRKPVLALRTGILPVSFDQAGTIGGSFEVQELESLATEVQSLVSKLNEKKISDAKADLALQIAHDIRSPLMLLQVLLKQAHGLNEEEHRLLSMVAERISKIANALVQNHSTRTAAVECRASSVVETIVSEKRVFYPEVIISVSGIENARNVLIPVDGIEFGRALSNLIDNAVEASRGRSRVSIQMERNENSFDIRTTDDGHGITEDRIRKLGVKGATFDKADGQGLGLFYTKRLVESVAGSLKIESSVGVGTTITLSIPIKAEQADSLRSHLTT